LRGIFRRYYDRAIPYMLRDVFIKGCKVVFGYLLPKTPILFSFVERVSNSLKSAPTVTDNSRVLWHLHLKRIKRITPVDHE